MRKMLPHINSYMTYLKYIYQSIKMFTPSMVEISNYHHFVTLMKHWRKKKTLKTMLKGPILLQPCLMLRLLFRRIIYHHLLLTHDLLMCKS